MELAYTRVSAKDQNPERQLVKFRELGIDERYIFIDKQSGKDFNRPRYQAIRLMIREDDLVYVDELDRLGRDYDGIISEWKYITQELQEDIVVLENETLFDSRKFRNMGWQSDGGSIFELAFLRGREGAKEEPAAPSGRDRGCAKGRREVRASQAANRRKLYPAIRPMEIRHDYGHRSYEIAFRICLFRHPKNEPSE
jgi:DNA invertase Pin-like site-specific DNA recombinase